MVERLLRASDAVCFGGAVLASLACLGMALMLIVEVITTSFFSWSQPWSVEYATYMLATSLFMGSGWALRAGGHIRVNAIFSVLPGRIVWLLDLVGSVFATGVIGFAAGALIEQAVRTYNLGSRSYFPSETLLVYPQSMLALSFALLTLALLTRTVRLLLRQPPERDAAGLMSTAGK